MIKYQLRCAAGHIFDVWFRDSASCDALLGSDAVACPQCGDHDVAKAPMAPRIGKPPESSAAEEQRQKDRKAELEKHLTAVRQYVEDNCDYVGDRFPEEARRIHYGEAPQRDIYGEASEADARELATEGVTFARLPWPSRSH